MTVLLPLEPVIATTGAVAARANSSMSPTTGKPRRRRGERKRNVRAETGRDDDARRHRRASARRASREPPRQRGTIACRSTRPGGCARLSMTRTCSPRSLRNRATATPVAPSPTIRLRFIDARSTPVSCRRPLLCGHRPKDAALGSRTRSFAASITGSSSSPSPTNTKMTVMIQKRTITFGSAQPLSSK